MVRLKKIYPTEKYGKYANLQELVSASAMRFGDKPLYKYFDADGRVREMSYCTFGNETKAIGTALAAYGLLGKRIAILSESRPEWMVGYVATIGGGGVTIPLDRELQTEQIRNFLNLSEANAIFFSAPYEKALLEMAPELPGVRAFIAFDEPAEPWPAELADRLFVYRRMAEDGREMYENGNDAYTSAHVDVYAMSAIIFTSGTTGTSKGVMLSHDNLLECVRASANMVNFSSRDVLLSVLPLHHTYETCCGMLTPICLGATVCINNSLKYVVRNMNIFRPTGMILVPLFVSTIYKKICDEVRKKGKEETARPRHRGDQAGAEGRHRPAQARLCGGAQRAGRPAEQNHLRRRGAGPRSCRPLRRAGHPDRAGLRHYRMRAAGVGQPVYRAEVRLGRRSDSGQQHQNPEGERRRRRKARPKRAASAKSASRARG